MGTFVKFNLMTENQSCMMYAFREHVFKVDSVSEGKGSY